MYKIKRKVFLDYLSEVIIDIESYSIIIEAKEKGLVISPSICLKAIQKYNHNIPTNLIDRYNGNKSNVNSNECKLI